MARPTLRVEIAFGTDPTEAPTWVDVSSYVRPPMRITRGRQRELDVVQCGTADIVLDNRDCRFDPLYPGVYWTFVKPMRRIRIAAKLDAPDGVFGLEGDLGDGWWALFTGYVESWDPETFVDGSRDSVTHVRCVDGFEPLARAMINTSFSQELSGSRIDAVLSLANWTTGSSWVIGSAVNGVVDTMVVGPSGDRALADGISLIVAQDIEQTSALQHAQDIAQAEGGWFFIGKDGAANFYDRHRLLKEPFVTPRCSFGDYPGDSGYDYTSLRPSYGCEWIYNQVIMQTISGAEQVVEDTSSKNAYLLRTLQQTDLPLVSDGEALSRARFMLDRYKEPKTRFDSIEFEGAIPDDIWEAILAFDLGEMIRVKHQPPGAISFWEQDSIIQGVTHDISDTGWKVSWWLAPHHSSDFWIVGNTTRGKVGTMRPAW